MSRAPAVIFDCDGVLVDSEELAWDAWEETLAEFDVELTETAVAALTGRTERDAYEYFSEVGPLPPLDQFSARLATALQHRFERHLEAFEDARHVVAELSDRDMTLAVASSSPRDRLDLSLERTGLGQYFRVSVAGDEVARAKPDPDLYLAAAEALGVKPRLCLAVEDSPVGIASARDAGMRVVAVWRDRYAHAELAAADAVVDRLTADVIADEASKAGSERG